MKGERNFSDVAQTISQTSLEPPRSFISSPSPGIRRRTESITFSLSPNSQTCASQDLIIFHFETTSTVHTLFCCTWRKRHSCSHPSFCNFCLSARLTFRQKFWWRINFPYVVYAKNPKTRILKLSRSKRPPTFSSFSLLPSFPFPPICIREKAICCTTTRPGRGVFSPHFLPFPLRESKVSADKMATFSSSFLTLSPCRKGGAAKCGAAGRKKEEKGSKKKYFFSFGTAVNSHQSYFSL